MIDFFQTLGIKRFVIADCENAETSSPKLLFEFLKEKDFLNLSTQIICFIGADSNQNRFYDRFTKYVQQKEIACNISSVRIDITADDALDKVIIAYLGMLMAQKPDAKFIIVSSDNGYEAVVKHFVETGIDVKQDSVPKPEKTITKKKTKSSTTTETKKTKINKEADVLVDKNIETATTKIIQLDKKKRPKKINTLRNKIENDNQNLTDGQIDLVIATLKNQHNMSVDDNGKITWK